MDRNSNVVRSRRGPGIFTIAAGVLLGGALLFAGKVGLGVWILYERDRQQQELMNEAQQILDEEKKSTEFTVEQMENLGNPD